MSALLSQMSILKVRMLLMRNKIRKIFNFNMNNYYNFQFESPAFKSVQTYFKIGTAINIMQNILQF